MVDAPSKPKVDGLKPQPRDFSNKNAKINDTPKTAKVSDNVLDETKGTERQNENL